MIFTANNNGDATKGRKQKGRRVDNARRKMHDTTNGGQRSLCTNCKTHKLSDEVASCKLHDMQYMTESDQRAQIARQAKCRAQLQDTQAAGWSPSDVIAARTSLYNCRAHEILNSLVVRMRNCKSRNCATNTIFKHCVYLALLMER